ncbi:hypothetical protein RUND412_001509 [Rhizina undulata]
MVATSHEFFLNDSAVFTEQLFCTEGVFAGIEDGGEARELDDITAIFDHDEVSDKSDYNRTQDIFETGARARILSETLNPLEVDILNTERHTPSNPDTNPDTDLHTSINTNALASIPPTDIETMYSEVLLDIDSITPSSSSSTTNISTSCGLSTSCSPTTPLSPSENTPSTESASDTSGDLPSARTSAERSKRKRKLQETKQTKRKKAKLPEIVFVDTNDEEAVKRARNTLAARRYRQKKVERMDELEGLLDTAEAERDTWREKALRMEMEAEKWRLLYEAVKK